METYWIVAPFCIIGGLSDYSIIYSFIKHKELNTIYEYQFVLIFSAFDLSNVASTLIPSIMFQSNQILCMIQGILIQTASLSGILWIGFIAVAMLKEFVLFQKRFSKGFALPLLVILAVAVGTAAVPAVFDAYKLSGNWCWIQTPEGSHAQLDYLFRFLLFYGIVWAVIVFNFAVSIAIYWKMNDESLFDFVGNRLVNRLKWYPWILCFCFLPITSVRIAEGLTEVPKWYALMSSIIIRTLGFFNAIAFFTSDKLRELRKKRRVGKNGQSILSEE